MKKIIAVLLSVLMLASILPMSSFAAQTTDTAVAEEETQSDLKGELTDVVNSFGTFQNPWADAQAGTVEYYMGILYTLVWVGLVIASMAVYTFDNGNALL